MPLHHTHEPYVSPEALTETLRALGVGGVVMPGQQSWNTWPVAAGPVVITPNAANETDGAAATLIAAAAITVPYYVVGFPFRIGAAGDFQLRLKLQSTTPTVYRILRAYGDRTTGPDAGIQAPGFPPIPIAANLGFQGIVATSPGAGPTVQAWAIVLTQSAVVPVADLLVAAPTAFGGMVPFVDSTGVFWATARTENTTVGYVWGNYVEITPGLPTAALVTAVWGNTEDSINHVQAAYATGASGGEVDWGIFGWPAPQSAEPSDARHNLMPFPFYLPANTRLAVRARAGGLTNLNFMTALEYIPIPLR